VATDDRPVPERPARLGRRAFLGSAALGAAALAAAGWTPDDASGSSPGPGRRVPFLGRHQPGVDTPAARFGLLAACDLVSEDRGRLARTLRDLTGEARGLMETRPPERRDSAYPRPSASSACSSSSGTAPPLNEQQKIIGRDKASGAPLGLDREHDDPAYGEDPAGHRVPLDAHIRIANPRTPETAGSRILRRGFNFSRGFDAAGRLDQGLAFVSYQKSLTRGFLAVQARFKGEPLEEYILPVGGGFFFVLPGVPSGDGWLGQQLLA
jgi:deferrochelatase/peroxidase EfeB